LRILSHYYVARFLGLFATVLVASLIVLATIELVLNLDDVGAFGSVSGGADVAGPFAVLRYLWVRLASYYLADLLPLASFVAVFVTFAWAGRSMELVAIQAGGIRPIRVIAPVLAMTLILSFATAILHETVILRARQIWSSTAEGGRDQPDFGRGSFWYHRGRTFTNVASADPETRTLHGVEIFERAPGGRIVRVLRSKRVRVDEQGVWHLENAAIWQFDPDDTTRDPQFEERSSYALRLDAGQGGALLAADPGLLPLRDLDRYLAAHAAESSSTLRRLRGLLHERLSSPWLVLVFGWLALPFALRIDARGRFGGPAAAAVATLGVYFLLETAGRTVARQELLPVGLVPWLLIGATCLGAWIALRLQRS
jgi:lipopolysaccharide export LptBFGC system permease protein LptF